jgi:hypothetical protein
MIIMFFKVLNIMNRNIIPTKLKIFIVINHNSNKFIFTNLVGYVRVVLHTHKYISSGYWTKKLDN